MNERIIAWLLDGETGLSSKNIVRYLTIGKTDGSFPRDPSDLRRCMNLFVQIPELQPKFAKMAEEGKVWKGLVENWDLLTETLNYEMKKPNNGKAPRTYNLLEEIIINGSIVGGVYGQSSGAV